MKIISNWFRSRKLKNEFYDMILQIANSKIEYCNAKNRFRLNYVDAYTKYDVNGSVKEYSNNLCYLLALKGYIEIDNDSVCSVTKEGFNLIEGYKGFKFTSYRLIEKNEETIIRKIYKFCYNKIYAKIFMSIIRITNKKRYEEILVNCRLIGKS
jgi:hypothetical protein